MAAPAPSVADVLADLEALVSSWRAEHGVVSDTITLWQMLVLDLDSEPLWTQVQNITLSWVAGPMGDDNQQVKLFWSEFNACGLPPPPAQDCRGGRLMGGFKSSCDSAY